MEEENLNQDIKIDDSSDKNSKLHIVTISIMAVFLLFLGGVYFAYNFFTEPSNKKGQAASTEITPLQTESSSQETQASPKHLPSVMPSITNIPTSTPSAEIISATPTATSSPMLELKTDSENNI